MTEVFKPVPEWESLYEISNIGNLRSIRSGKILSKVLMRHGYLKATLCSVKQVQRTYHELVALAFIGPRPYGMDINHKNGNKADNRACNLEYCSRRENNLHAVRLGLRTVFKGTNGKKRGVNHMLAVLNDDLVRRIYAEKSNPTRVSQEGIAKKFGIARTTVSSIWCGRTWAHVTQAEGL